MRELARRLNGVRIDIQPYQSDAAPQTLRIEGMGGVQ